MLTAKGNLPLSSPDSVPESREADFSILAKMFGLSVTLFSPPSSSPIWERIVDSRGPR